MRELKFRAWDSIEERYYYWRIEDCFSVGVHAGCMEKFTFEQSTGLKDKNGKEIYEGDIVLDYYDGDDAFIVDWDKDTASFVLTDTCNISNVSFDNFYPDKDLEIIGNIHEHQELLEAKDVD